MSGSCRDGRTALVLYGSETGNAQDVAQELGRLVERLHFSSMVTSLDSIEPKSLCPYSLVLIAISTTGQGDLPANAKLFWKKILRKKLPIDCLASVKFALFGLGDSSYPKFNWAALKLFKRLVQLGAEPVVPKGEGDEQHPEGIDSMYIPWATTLQQQVLESYPLEGGLEPIPDTVLLPPQWLLAPAGSNGYTRNGISKVMHTTGTGVHGTDLEVVLETNSRVTAEDHWQDVRHLKFTCKESVQYAPGDILTIFPENAEEDVNNLLRVLGWTEVADAPLCFEPNKDAGRPLTAPQPSLSDEDRSLTLRSLLTRHLDLNAIPRRSFFALIMHFTEDEFQRNRLQEFTDPQYTDELFDYTTRPRRSILEVLQEFDTLKIPWQWAATILPSLRGRQFSIASGGQLKSGEGRSTSFDLLVAIVKYKTVIRKIRRGTCTRYLESLPLGSKLNVTLVKGTLGISNSDLDRPIIMVGPGTGVAPMRSLIWERLQWHRNTVADGDGSMPSDAMGQNLLIFGCRSRDSDYFFQSEWEDLKHKMPLEVLPAFSRDQQKKVYVQDVIAQNKDLVCRLVHEQGGIVYVCGSSGKMPQAVREALIDAFQHGFLESREAAETYLQTMEKQNRYKQETW